MAFKTLPLEDRRFLKIIERIDWLDKMKEKKIKEKETNDDKLATSN